VPTYGDNQEVTLTGPVKIEMEGSYWADSFERPGATNVPPAFRDQYRVKPTASFLVIDLMLINHGAKPLSLPITQPPMLTLQNAQGVEFAKAGGEVNFDDITLRVLLGQLNMNPDMPVRTKTVFDVPKGDYVLLVSFGRYVSGGHLTFAKGATLFKFALNPKNR
jgi:hypothetical protein